VLYPNAKKDPSKIFWNEILPKVILNIIRKTYLIFLRSIKQIIKVTLFGPASLDEHNVARPKVNAELWDVTHTTPGAIAFAAMMVSQHFLFT
jgi:hypothetical protein